MRAKKIILTPLHKFLKIKTPQLIRRGAGKKKNLQRCKLEGIVLDAERMAG